MHAGPKAANGSQSEVACADGGFPCGARALRDATGL